jgi:hypothetical protein
LGGVTAPVLERLIFGSLPLDLGRLEMRRSRFAQAGFIVLFLAGCSSSGTPAPGTPGPVDSSPIPSAAAATASPGATGSAAALPSATASAWQRAADQPGLADVQLAQVIWTGQRFLAAGMSEIDAGSAILDSEDGQTWHEQKRFGQQALVVQLIASPNGVLAVGSFGANARSWFSKDGLSWTAAPFTAALRPAKDRMLRMNAAVRTPTGWLAVGEEDTPCSVGCEEDPRFFVRAVAWTSPDGLSWSQEPAGTALAQAGMTGIVAGGPGYVAVGGALDRPTVFGSPAHAVAWTSTDGRAWTRLPDAPMFHAPAGTDQTSGTWMAAVAAGNGDLVAVGTVGTQLGTGPGLAWRSTDGRTWSLGSSATFRDAQLLSVAAVPGGFLAAGPSVAESCLGGTWYSTDGTNWACIATDPAFTDFAASAAAGSSAIDVVVGLPASEAGDSIVWTRPVP